MTLLVLALLLITVTIFQPYLEMQMNWYILELKHWKYQTHSAFLIKRVEKHLQKSTFYLQRNDMNKAALESAKAKVLLEKNMAMFKEIQKVIENFRNTYIS